MHFFHSGEFYLPRVLSYFSSVNWGRSTSKIFGTKDEKMPCWWILALTLKCSVTSLFTLKQKNSALEVCKFSELALSTSYDLNFWQAPRISPYKYNFKSTWTELRDEPITRLQRFQISYLKLCSCVGLSCAQTKLQSLAGLHQHNSNYQ
jgi:hypothetical protein